jgi:hypothetical protein
VRGASALHAKRRLVTEKIEHAAWKYASASNMVIGVK